MSTAIWRIAIDGTGRRADDLSGVVVGKLGGRWNRPGTPLVYCSESIALAQLEIMGHMNLRSLEYVRYVVRIEVPDEIWTRCEVLRTLPAGWDSLPPHQSSIDTGEAWIASVTSPLLMVPSVIVPEEHNVLLNPAHPDASALKASLLRRWLTVHLPFLAGASHDRYI